VIRTFIAGEAPTNGDGVGVSGFFDLMLELSQIFVRRDMVHWATKVDHAHLTAEPIAIGNRPSLHGHKRIIQSIVIALIEIGCRYVRTRDFPQR
jgi:hypothetical protein